LRLIFPSHIIPGDREIFDTDDPRWIASQEETAAVWQVIDKAAWGILDHEPDTLGAVTMLLEYVVAHVQDQNEAAWPDDWLSEMVRHLTGALRTIDAKMAPVLASA